VGDDLYGRRILESFRSVGTDTSLLELRSGHVTPLSVILVNRRNGSRTIVNRTLRHPALQIRESKWSEMSSPRVLLFDGHALEASLAALAAFPDATSILDAGSWREGTATLAGKVDYLAASERFALQSTDLPDLRTDDHRRRCLDAMREQFETTVIVTLGEDGLIVDDGSGLVHLPAVPVQTVDTTAAGDIFHGAFAYGVNEGMPLDACLRLASQAAALAVQRAGGRSSIPSLDRVRQAMRRK
jgi:sugar/nucleoside kinase (ribokinase family)